MKSKLFVPIVSVILVLLSVLLAVGAVSLEKNKEVRLDQTDVSFSDFTVTGKKMDVTITSANSLGIKISGNSYTYENGVLKFKLYGSKDLNVGEPLKTNQVLNFSITADGEIREIYFLTVNDDGEEVENKKSFVRG